MSGGEAMREAMERVAALPAPAVLADQQLVAAIGAVEELAHHVQALQLALTGELEVRSEGGPDGDEGLARTLGQRGAAQAVEMLAKCSAKEAGRRVRACRRLRAFPLVHEALDAGVLGLEHAEAIMGPLGLATRVAGAGEVAVAEAALVESARTLSADLVAEQAKLWQARLDQDGIEPAFDDTLGKRFFHIGRVVDGLAKVTGLLPATHVAAIQPLLDACVNPRGAVRFRPAGEGNQVRGELGARDTSGTSGTSESLGGGLAADIAGQKLLPRDARTAGQKRADALRDICAAQARCDQTPELGGDHPTVWVRTTETELADGRGLAFLDGISEPVPVSVADQAACTGGIQEVIFTDDGQALRLGRTRRGFTHRQRRAITLRDGNTCVIPGCATPARWCEVHHVTAHKDGGATDIDNAVHLCWHHHHDIDSGPWRLRMTDGRPQIRWVYGTHASEWAWATPPPLIDTTTTPPPG